MSQEDAVPAKVSKTAQVAFQLISDFGLPMIKQKLVSLIYLCDWKHCLTNDCQITDIQWTRWMGAVPLIGNETSEMWASVIDFELSDKKHVKLLQSDLALHLDQSALDAIAHCHKTCKPMDILEFTRLVCSTHPFLVSNNYEDLNLPTLSRIYKTDY